MKLIRTAKGVTIELDWNECDILKLELETTTTLVGKALHSELDELLTEEKNDN